MIKYMLALSLVFVAAHATADEYVEVTKDNVNIRTDASESAEVVSQAYKGMIFKLGKKNGDWYGIVTPSGEYRYLHSSLGTISNTEPTLTDSEAVLKVACQEIIAAEGKANEEAQAIEPDILKQIDVSRVFVDKYKLAIFKKHDIPPARSVSLNVWCATN